MRTNEKVERTMSLRLPDLSQAVSREKEGQKANERRRSRVSMILLSRVNEINNKNMDNDNNDNDKDDDNNNHQQG